jgi:hypothetical protein
MAEPASFMLLATACVGAKNYPGLESYGSDRFAVVLWLFQKKDSPPLTAEKLAQIDQKAAQVLQRQPVQRQIDCGKGRPGDNQGGQQGGAGGQNGQGGSQNGNHLNNQDMNEFDDPDIGRPGDRIGQGGFVSANDKDKHKHRPGVQFPGENGNNPHVGAEGGSTVLKPGVTYVKPGVTSPLQGGSNHPKVQKLQEFIQNWFRDPNNKKQGAGHGGNGFGGGGQGGFGNGNGNDNDNLGDNDFGNGYGGENGGGQGYGGGVGFRLGGGKQTLGPENENATESVLPSEETVSESPQ